MSNGELAMAYAVAKPMEAHVDALGLFLLDRIRGQANAEFVVAQDARGRLCVAEGRSDIV
jgi:hypothetical protein